MACLVGGIWSQFQAPPAHLSWLREVKRLLAGEFDSTCGCGCGVVWRRDRAASTSDCPDSRRLRIVGSFDASWFHDGVLGLCVRWKQELEHVADAIAGVGGASHARCRSGV